MNFETMFFDLDDTLYPSTSGVWEAIGYRMDKFMTEILGFDPEQVPTLRTRLFRQYGTTLRGLKMEYNIDELFFLEFVHDIPLERYLQPDKDLADTLNLYSDRKVIFTNASQDHARRVIAILGLDGIFSQIIDISQFFPACKPMPESFQKAFEIAGIHEPGNCVVIDDSPRNLDAASQLGLFTIQVGTHSRSAAVDAAVLSLHDLPSVIPVDANIRIE
jgi:pyrimidine 5'-nucleotidase